MNKIMFNLIGNNSVQGFKSCNRSYLSYNQSLSKNFPMTNYSRINDSKRNYSIITDTHLLTDIAFTVTAVTCTGYLYDKGIDHLCDSLYFKLNSTAYHQMSQKNLKETLCKNFPGIQMEGADGFDISPNLDKILNLLSMNERNKGSSYPYNQISKIIIQASPVELEYFKETLNRMNIVNQEENKNYSLFELLVRMMLEKNRALSSIISIFGPEESFTLAKKKAL